MKSFALLFLLNIAWGASDAEKALNRPELLKEIRVEKGGVVQISEAAKKAKAKGDLVLTFYCPKGSSKCELQKVNVTDKPLKK